MYVFLFCDKFYAKYKYSTYFSLLFLFYSLILENLKNYVVIVCVCERDFFHYYYFEYTYDISDV